MIGHFVLARFSQSFEPVGAASFFQGGFHAGDPPQEG